MFIRSIHKRVYHSFRFIRNLNENTSALLERLVALLITVSVNPLDSKSVSKRLSAQSF